MAALTGCRTDAELVHQVDQLGGDLVGVVQQMKVFGWQGADRPSPSLGFVPLAAVGVAEGQVRPWAVVPAFRDGLSPWEWCNSGP